MTDGFSDLLLPFGQDLSGRLVHASTVPRGLACGCICPQCAAPLQARQGDVLRHHFAHAADARCSGALETALHKLAKQIIVETGRVWVPELAAGYPTQWTGEEFRVQLRVCKQGWIVGSATAEVTMGDIRPDVVVQAASMPLAVEIFVAHEVDGEKRAKIRSADLSTIEIDLSGYPRSFDPEELRYFVLREAPRFWIHHQKQAEVLDLARQEYHEEYSRRQAARLARERAEEEKRLAEWGRKWDAENSPEARLARQRAADFARAADIERAKVVSMSGQGVAVDLGGLRRAALLRPTRWSGIDNYPSAGAFCGKCDGSNWYQTNTGWACQQCAPGLALRSVA
jgi:hypothetical protein